MSLAIPEVNCPYCRQKLDPPPNRRKQCPFCRKYINIKTRYPDNVRILVTEEEARRIDEEWRQRQLEGERNHFPADWQVRKYLPQEDDE